MRLRQLWTSLRSALPLGLGVGLCLPVAALVRVESLAPLRIRWALRLASSPSAGWPGNWSDAALTPGQLEGAAFGRALGLLCGLAALAWLAAMSGTVLGALRKAAAGEDERVLRSNLGATRRQLRVEAVRESAGVALMACAGGLMTAVMVAEMLIRGLPTDVEGIAGSGISLLTSSPVAAALLVVTGLLGAGAPLMVSRFRSDRQGWIGGLAVSQVAACIAVAASAILLVGAAPTVDDSVRQYAHARDTLVLRVRLPESAVAGTHRGPTWNAVRAAVASLPGVTGAGLSSPGAALGKGVVDRGGAHCPDCSSGGLAAPAVFGRARHMAVDPNFFALLGLDVERAGPSSEKSDASRDAGAASGVIVDRRLHAAWFQGKGVTERRVWLRGDLPLVGPGHPVLGMVDAPRPGGLRVVRDALPAVFLPFSVDIATEADLLVRGYSRTDGAAMPASLRRAVAGAAPGAHVDVLGRLDRLLAARMEPVRWLAGLTAALAGVSVLLALVGCAGAMAERVRRRTAEIGLRRAVGARRRDIARLVRADARRLLAVGGFVGAAFAASVNRGIPMLVAGLEPLSAATLAAVVVGLAAAGWAASAGAASRAARLDPVEALRY